MKSLFHQCFCSGRHSIWFSSATPSSSAVAGQRNPTLTSQRGAGQAEVKATVQISGACDVQRVQSGAGGESDTGLKTTIKTLSPVLPLLFMTSAARFKSKRSKDLNHNTKSVHPLVLSIFRCGYCMYELLYLFHQKMLRKCLCEYTQLQLTRFSYISIICLVYLEIMKLSSFGK